MTQQGPHAAVAKTFRFEAAHHLPNHDGKCREPHGHSYRVVVHCQGRINISADSPKRGMVIDFADIKAVWSKELKPLLDHKDLNVSLEGMLMETTAECLAFFICTMFRNCAVPVTSVEVWETETSMASVEWTEVWARA